MQHGSWRLGVGRQCRAKTAGAGMFSQYEPVAGRERRRKTRGEKIKQRMLRSSYDENTRSYTTLRASNSYAANWLERRRARALSGSLDHAREGALCDAAL